MIVSPRLNRAALTFLLFGTVAAILPSQDNAALANNGCFTGPSGSTGQLAIAPTSSTIQSAYILTPPNPAPTTYRIYFKPDAASAYTQLSTGNSKTTFVIKTGQVAVNGTAYSAPNPPSVTASSFTAAQAVSYVGKTTYYAGSMTATATYIYVDSTGRQTTYTATAAFSTP